MNVDCSGCHRTGTAACDAVFRCRKCGKERSVCAYLPGGFKAFTQVVEIGGRECVLCEEARKLGDGWVDKWHRKLKPEAG